MDTKPSKKNLPIIRQTKTSMYRMVKANPLLNLSEIETENRLAKATDATKQSAKVKKTTIIQSKPFTRSHSVRAAKGQSTAKVPQVKHNVRSITIDKPTTTEIRTEVKHKVAFTATPIEASSMFRKYRATPFKIAQEEVEANDLCQHLTEWLIACNKSCNSFKRLQNFASNSIGFDDDNKENIEHFGIHRSNSYENLRIAPNSQTLTPADKNEYDLKKLACSSLSDLHNLILQGYPFIQSEAWLELIYDKYHIIEKQPEYWECRALIEQNRDNITAAVEYYRTAIIHGAEVHTVDRSLEELLQKFSLLNIGSDENQKPRNKKERVRILHDARNIFKTSIIQGAVLERNCKQKEVLPDVLDTPVHSNTSR